MGKHHRHAGLLWVGAQFLLIGVWTYLVLTDYKVLLRNFLDRSPLSAVGTITLFGGLIITIVATINLGSSLTPLPEPKESARLITSGLYGRIRHPIYTGILLIVWGGTLLRLAGNASGTIPLLILSLFMTIFFTLKSIYEETQLINRYPEYGDYRKSTGRFLPWV